ncbi:MAG TPA: tRNA pseudouridine(55) synthase TruB [bacterium]|nr:MAG: tRNA pseudouridine synthase B [Parcubacteria group bacterium ADurb.Bin192]HPN15474.1 tRNA pseudouridine(55) synthase TruB [bacterium]
MPDSPSLMLLIDKPAGITSHDVVDKVRRIYKTRRVGHGGTLDPFATGLLLVGVGSQTKKLHDVVGLDKTYEATAQLGGTSDTYDLTGVVVARPTSLVPRREDIEEALAKFRGTIEQKAPAYSAKKVGGQKLYELARKGVDVEHLRPTKKVDITELVITEYSWPVLKFRVTCSSGTYIRSLAHDIGEQLGCGAYLKELRRTRIGPYKLKDAKSLEDLLTGDWAQ